METVAFYSYKGGVGRSLLLANAAQFLATLGRGVVALDFDFEAPGLHYKLAAEPRHATKGGAVPYLVATAEGASSPPPLESHMTSLAVPSDENGWLRLMPAGPAPEEEYWTALKRFGEALRLDDASGRGFMAILDLQARIAEELRPDYLLVDARTGVTELGGLATTILADTVVCLFAANQESLDGTVKVVEALKAAPRLATQKPIRIVPVLARVTEGSRDDSRFAAGINQLLALTDPRKNSGKGKDKVKDKRESTLFSLPHDDLFGGAERLVGGEQKASAFSPLYKAYLELFQELFPSRAELAQKVLERLEAVADIRQTLTTSRRNRYGVEDGFSPWDALAIAEGVLIEGAPQHGKGSRFADLVCRNDAGHALIVVEYGAEATLPQALEFWNTKTKVPCVVLLTRKENYVSEQIYAREPGNGRLRDTDRWDLPSPREFELLRDVGDRSVESMLDAVRHGHTEAVAWLVREWLESVSTGAGRKPREPHWQPERARRILDGLAATEDLACAEEILNRTAPGGAQYYRRGNRLQGDCPPGAEDDRRMTEELFAPLFWRLPVEAVLKSMRLDRQLDETPAIAGFQLIARGLMGLRYDPERDALLDARELSRRGSRGGQSEVVDQEAVSWIIRRSRRERGERIQLSDEIPPALVWEEMSVESAHWRGTLEEARQKIGEKRPLQSTSGLRARLRAMAARQALATDGLFGSRTSSGRIELYPAAITTAAEVLGLIPRYLKSVVFIQLSVWDLAYIARDLDGQPGYGFAPAPMDSPLVRPSPVHITLVQAFTHKLISRLKDPNLEAAFQKLATHQPEPYARWTTLRNLPLERLRGLLLGARGNAHTLGFPISETET